MTKTKKIPTKNKQKKKKIKNENKTIEQYNNPT